MSISANTAKLRFAAAGSSLLPRLARSGKPKCCPKATQIRACQCQISPIDIDEFLDDIESQPTPRRFFIEPDPAAQHLLGLGLGQTRSIVFNDDLDAPVP